MQIRHVRNPRRNEFVSLRRMHRAAAIAAHVSPSAATVDAAVRAEPTMASKPNPNPLTTHVLDTASGRPAAQMPIDLYVQRGGDGTAGGASGAGAAGGAWEHLRRVVTNADGRVTGELLSEAAFKPGTYKMRFDTAAYFAAAGVEAYFYPYAEIVFVVHDASQHYHVPLLLSPFGYSTYRGS